MSTFLVVRQCGDARPGEMLVVDDPRRAQNLLRQRYIVPAGEGPLPAGEENHGESNLKGNNFRRRH